MTLQLLLSIAMMLTGAVPPRWLDAVTLFPLCDPLRECLFVSEGGATPEESERHGKVMHLPLLTAVGAFALSLALRLIGGR